MSTATFSDLVGGELGDEFSSLAADLQQFTHHIEEARAAKQRLVMAVNEYEAKRREIFQRRLEESDNYWCWKCDRVHVRAHMKLVYVALHGRTSEGYEADLVDGWVGYVCPPCWQRIRSNRQEVFPYQHIAEGYCIHVHEVQIEGDGLFFQNYRKEREGVPSATEDRRCPKIISPKMTLRFHLPPRIEFIKQGQDSILQTNPSITYYAGGQAADTLLVNDTPFKLAL